MLIEATSLATVVEQEKRHMISNNDTSEKQRRSLPIGYRQGIVTAITIFLGFSLAFLRFWAFEAPGTWTPRSVLSTVALGIPIALEVYVLYRSLRVADDDEEEYAKTVCWFIVSIVLMLAAVIFEAVILAQDIEPNASTPTFMFSG